MKHFAGAQVFEGLSPRRAEIFLPKALNPEALRFCALNFHIALLNALSELRTRKGSVQMTHVFILYSLWVFIDFYGSVVLKAFLKKRLLCCKATAHASQRRGGRSLKDHLDARPSNGVHIGTYKPECRLSYNKTSACWAAKALVKSLDTLDQELLIRTATHFLDVQADAKESRSHRGLWCRYRFAHQGPSKTKSVSG